MKNASFFLAAFLSLGLTSGALASEATDTALGGAALGAIAGGVIGGRWSDAAVGAVAGGGLGYVIGNEKDKRLAREQAEQERLARERARISDNPDTAYRPPYTTTLAGTSWRVVSLKSDTYPDYASMVVTFATESKLTTMAETKDGKTDSWIETYRVVDDVLVVSGKDPKTDKTYVINAPYKVQGDLMTVETPEARFVLEKI